MVRSRDAFRIRARDKDKRQRIYLAAQVMLLSQGLFSINLAENKLNFTVSF
jgi:hypothetical protein